MINVFIFHSMEGSPDEHWLPWLKGGLEAKGYKVFALQFPSPPGEAPAVEKWFEILSPYEQQINKDTIFVGYSIGGVFALRILERLAHPIKAAFFVATPIGVRPIVDYYDRVEAFSGFGFDWANIKTKAQHFTVYQSDNDPYVSPGNGEKLAQELGVGVSLIANAGHFNTTAGYTRFEKLLSDFEPLL